MKVRETSHLGSCSAEGCRYPEENGMAVVKLATVFVA
jgi:hypothetical protein